jgi:hypothetical protein
MKYTATEYNFRDHWIPKKGIFYMYKVENDNAEQHNIFKNDHVVLAPLQEPAKGRLVMLRNFEIVLCTDKNSNDVIANIISVHSRL